MIIREAFDDVRRFSEFQKDPGLAKNILAARLKHLVDIGVFEIRRPLMTASTRNTS